MSALAGLHTAMVTPFDPEGRVDEEAAVAMARHLLASGSDGLVVCGTTGEAATLTSEEHLGVIRLVASEVGDEGVVIAGAGSNDTRHACEMTEQAVAAGVDAVLSVTPYYNKPNRRGIRRHYEEVARAAAGTPVILYNIPGRSVIDMTPETMGRLAKHRNIVGVKDSTSNLARPLHTKRACGEDFIQLSGEDHLALAFNAAGGVGCISVTANVAPRLCAEMHKAWREGRLGEAMGIQDRLVPLHDALFAETSPAPVKYAASLLGKGTDRCRLPLAPVSEPTRKRVREAMVSAGLLN